MTKQTQEITGKAGRTWPRIIDDLVRYIPGTGHMNLSPIEASRSISNRPFNSLCYLSISSVPYKVQSLDESRLVYYFVLANIMYHMEVHIIGADNNGDESYYDFHLIPSNNHVYEQGYEQYSYVCQQTGTGLEIIIRPPEFTSDDLADFSQHEINQRYHLFKEYKPSASCPTPAMCFQTLYKIILQPLVSDEPKEIAANNPTLNMRVNPQILSKLYFTFDDERNCYAPPNLHDFTKVETVEIRKHMTRMLVEAAVLTLKADSKDFHSFPFHLENAVPVLLNTLPTPLLQPSRPVSQDYYRFYVVLGATETFPEEALLQRYEIQVRNDPRNAHYYLDALKNLAQFLGSEFLEVRVLELMSLGVATVSDVSDAYAKYNLPMESDIADTELIKLYSELVDRDPQSKDGLLRAANVIANTTNSETLRKFLHNAQMDLPQAYRFLEIPTDAADDAVIATFDLKFQESMESGSEDLPKQALLLIAKARNSPLLFSRYEETVFGTVLEMSLDSAYGLLGVDSTMDEQSIVTIFDIRQKDNPDSILELRQALGTIASDRDSRQIKRYLKSGTMDVAEEENLMWPVGLNNIGNTCYLNSLFQSYFTISPLRNAVLEFEDSPNKEEVSGMVNKKVGGRDVTQWEIKRSQEFVKHLAELFNELIHTTKRYISPKRDLAYLALVPAQEDPEHADNDVEMGPRDKAQGKTGDTPKIVVREADENDFEDSDSIQAPEPILIDVDGDEDDEDVDIENIDGGPDGGDLSVPKIEKAENTQDTQMDDEVLVDESEPASGLATSRLTTSGAPSIMSSDDLLDQPVLPPRPASAVAKERLRRIDTALLGRQQDVTECIENVLFQIESALKPSGFDEDGEQLDIVKDLFYGKTKQLLESDIDGSNRREKEERFSSLLVDVADGPRDIYDALDAYFGEDILELEGGATRRSVTISRLPPILQIQVQRVQYDRVLHQPFKSLALLKFDEVIYMDRYLDGDDILRQKRRGVFTWRRDLTEVKKRLAEVNNRGVSEM